MREEEVEGGERKVIYMLKVRSNQPYKIKKLMHVGTIPIHLYKVPFEAGGGIKFKVSSPISRLALTITVETSTHTHFCVYLFHTHTHS